MTTKEVRGYPEFQCRNCDEIIFVRFDDPEIITGVKCPKCSGRMGNRTPSKLRLTHDEIIERNVDKMVRL